jgi:FkbM family methyltransferase
MAGIGWVNDLLGRFGLRLYGEKAYSHALLSYSQEGEDMILRRIFEGKQKGFYVDVGAYHPQRFSNTYFFYVRGWRGINIDARPGCMDLFNAVRPDDINIESAIANERREMTYFMFDDPALNSFDEKLSRSRDKTAYSIIDRRTLFTAPLAEVLDEHLAPDQEIDFLSVDVEGLDLEVLKSNNWDKYRPYCVLVERTDYSLERIERDDVYGYLKEKNYDLFAKTANTLIFRAANQMLNTKSR